MAKYLIIGGVAGGATTAARLRRLDEKAEIVLFERGEHISYANCGMPYYLGGTIEEREKLFVQTPEQFRAALNVDVRSNTEVARIDRAAKRVHVTDLTAGSTYTETYDKLVLSPGANPVKPPIPGVELPGIYTLRDVRDTDALARAVDGQSRKRIVIVGAGYIGLEMAENMHKRGLQVTIVEIADQVIGIIDYDMAAQVHQHLKSKSIELFLNDGVSAFERNGEELTVTLNSGRKLPADIVLLSIGVKPEVGLATKAELEIGQRGGIVVDEYMRTSDPDIYALGDAVEVLHPVIDSRLPIPLAGPANKQGRIVADNIVLGNRRRYAGSVGTGIAKVFDLSVASAGASEKMLKRAGIPYLASITHSSSHAGYYPNAQPLTVKILFSPDDGRLFGTQVVGYGGVDKRIDVMAAYLKNGGTVYDLQELEHAYAPPFSSAKDPVNVAGFVADNILSGVVRIIHWHELDGLVDENVFLLDVRTPEEYRLGTIEGAVNIPHTELRERLHEVPADRPVVVFCHVGYRAYIAYRILTQNGFDEVKNLSGGYKTYELAVQDQGNEDLFDRELPAGEDAVLQTFDAIA